MPGRAPTGRQVLAARGFVVWQMDNRGSSGRGHAFETPLYRRLGKTELADQLEGVRYLLRQGFVDPARVGIYGWSYGGFHDAVRAAECAGRVSRRHRGSAGNELAQLRHHLYRALFGAAVGKRRRIPRQFAGGIRRPSSKRSS